MQIYVLNKLLKFFRAKNEEAYFKVLNIKQYDKKKLDYIGV